MRAFGKLGQRPGAIRWNNPDRNQKQAEDVTKKTKKNLPDWESNPGLPRLFL